MSEKIEFESLKDKDDLWVSRTRKKLSSGMTAEFGYWEYDNEDGGVDREVYFTIYQKRSKRWPDDKRTTTGRDGLEPAMWALKCLAQIEKPSIHYSYVRVNCGWMDERRRDGYTRVLSRRGYQRTFHRGVETLTKRIERV